MDIIIRNPKTKHEVIVDTRGIAFILERIKEDVAMAMMSAAGLQPKDVPPLPAEALPALQAFVHTAGAAAAILADDPKRGTDSIAAIYRVGGEKLGPPPVLTPILDDDDLKSVPTLTNDQLNKMMGEDK